jgi:sugar lactone lactonase YvrE
VFFGDVRAQITRVSSDTVSVIVPRGNGLAALRVELDGQTSESFPASIARIVAEELHPVANPVFDGEGCLFVTFSGGRGEKAPVSVFQISPDEKIEPFLSEISNPTGMALGRDGNLYISSRFDGIVYRVGPDRGVEIVAQQLGVATGLAFDPDGVLFVGDRQGTVFCIGPNGEPRTFCHLPPSMAAYHLAFDSNGYLYVAAPSLSTVDSIYRVSPDAKVEVFCTGLGRPQGMAFDVDGNLYVADALAGDSGIYRITPGGERGAIVSGPPLVGLAFDGKGGAALAGSDSVFHLQWGIRGKALI